MSDITRTVDRFIADKRTPPGGRHDIERLPPGTLPFVTLSSQSGAGGHVLAEALTELLEVEGAAHEELRDWRVFDKSMCRHILENERLAESVQELLDEEYHSQIEEFVSGIFGRRGSHNVAYVRLSRLIRTVASVGKVIILGHGGCLATRELAGGLHARLVAPLEIRAERMAPRLELDVAATSRAIRQRDEEQRKLLKTHYRVDGTDPELYDLVCNTERLLPRTAAELIVAVLRKRVA